MDPISPKSTAVRCAGAESLDPLRHGPFALHAASKPKPALSATCVFSSLHLPSPNELSVMEPQLVSFSIFVTS